MLTSGSILNLMNNFIKLGDGHSCSCVGHGMDDIQAREWAISQFGTAKLGDLRNQKRLLKIAATVVRSGGGTISKVMTDPREREAAYDFVENERISAEAVGHAAAVATARQLAREPFVWLAVDGSSLSFPDFPMPVLKRSQGRVRVVARSLTIGQAVTHIAEIGGYIGKSSGGPPGSTTIGRGFERIQLVAERRKLANDVRVIFPPPWPSPPNRGGGELRQWRII